MAEKTEDALGGIAAPKAEEAKSAAKTYETPLKEAYEAGDLPAPESAVGGTGNGSHSAAAPSECMACRGVCLPLCLHDGCLDERRLPRRDLLDVGRRNGRHIHSFRSPVAGACA